MRTIWDFTMQTDKKLDRNRPDYICYWLTGVEKMLHNEYGMPI